MLKKIFFLGFSVLCFNAFSQKTITVYDVESKNPVSNISASLNGNTPIVSSQKGEITFNELREGDKIVFNSNFYESTTIVWNKNISQVFLKKSSKELKETQIIGQRPRIKVEAGKTTMDVSKATIQQGTLKDLIQQIPGVVLDNNNNVTIKGKSGLRVLVDGKTSQLAVSDMKTFMESIPAGSIKSIEILTNPGAQYDAQGKAGIISIKLKKDKNEGFNTKISAGVGSLLNKYNGGIFSNYKNNLFNVFGNYQFNYKDQWYGYSENRMSTPASGTQYFDYVASWESINRIHNIKTGVDVFINPNTTISYTLDYNANIGTGNNHNDNYSSVYDENRDYLLNYVAYNNSKNDIKTLSNGLSFRRTFDSSKVEWTADVSHTYFIDQNSNINENYAYNAAKVAVPSQYYYFEPILDNKVHNLMFKTDVSVPNDFAKIDFGLKNESNFNRNIYVAFLKNYSGARYTNDNYKNDFNYNENIFASYLNINKNISIVSVDAGLRLENTVISSNNPAVSRQYLNFFPNIGISMPLDSTMNFSARYSRRIERPNFNQLNNRKVYYNKYTANIGVPTLQPEISNIASAQIDKTLLNGKLNVALGVEYNVENNNISEYNFIDSATYVSYFTYGNIGTAKLFNSYINIYCKPSSLFDINLTPQYMYSDYNSNNNGVESRSKGSSFQLSGQWNLYLPSQIKFSLNGFMTTNMVWAQGSSDFLGTLNGSISKSFLKGKLNVELSCQDLFNSNIWVGYQTTGNVRSVGTWKPETRIAWLNATYSFGKKINYKRKDIEKSDRLKGSGR